MADRNWIDRTDEIARIQKKSGLGGYNPDLTGGELENDQEMVKEEKSDVDLLYNY